MEIYTKRVRDMFKETPGECKSNELIRALYEASSSDRLAKDKINPTIALGYIKKADGKMILFKGEQKDIQVKLSSEDLLIVYSSH